MRIVLAYAELVAKVTCCSLVVWIVLFLLIELHYRVTVQYKDVAVSVALSK